MHVATSESNPAVFTNWLVRHALKGAAPAQALGAGDAQDGYTGVGAATTDGASASATKQHPEARSCRHYSST